MIGNLVEALDENVCVGVIKAFLVYGVWGYATHTNSVWCLRQFVFR